MNGETDFEPHFDSLGVILVLVLRKNPVAKSDPKKSDSNQAQPGPIWQGSG